MRLTRRHVVPALLLGNVGVLAVAATSALALGASTLAVPPPPGSAGAALLAQVDQEIASAAVAEPLTAPDDWATAQRGEVPVGAYDAAARATAARKAATRATDPALAAAPWQAMGPSNIGGRVTDVVVDPANADRLWSATASGGVWTSSDAGVTFSPAWDPAVGGAVGALALGGDGVLWAGTGESNPGGGGTTYPGSGVYRSADGGRTWQRSGLPRSARFGRIVVDPTDPQRVWAAAAGDLFRPGGERGLYLTEDSGRTWRKVLAGDNGTTGAVDVALQPGSPGTVLAAMWDHQRTPQARVYGGPGSGLFRSTDGGRSWTRIAEVTAGAEDGVAQTGRIGVAFSPADPDRAYAVVANRLNGTGVGLWRSDDAGASWTKTAEGDELSQNTFGWWFGRVYADPDDADRVFVAGLELQDSTDGGESFTPQSVSLVGSVSGVDSLAIHADQHALAWAPSDPRRVYLGNDGGMYTSRADGRAGTWTGALRQGWTQHYSVDVSRSDPSKVVTGLQDNRCHRNHLEAGPGRADLFNKIGFCGDGLQTLIDPQDERTTYSCSQYGSCSRNTAGVGGLVLPGSFKPAAAGPRYGWWAPVQFDPTDSRVLYFGGSALARSTDRGTSWTAVSPDLTGDPEQTDPNAGYRIFGTITTVAAAPADPERVYVGTDTGLLWTTADVTADEPVWERIDEDPRLPEGRWVTRLTVDPADARTVYATWSGYREGSDEAHVARSTDAGATWTDLSGDLPDAPVNELVVADGALVVGTDTGVFLSRTDRTWLAVGGGLPVVPVFDLDWHPASRSLTASTFGYGLQRVVLPPAAGAALR